MTTLTRDERVLLAAVSRHLRGGQPAREWPIQLDDLTRADFDEDDIRVYRRDSTNGAFQMWATRYRYRSVVEAVDLAVALGLLPHRFSSSWRAAQAEIKKLREWNDELKTERDDLAGRLLDARFGIAEGPHG